MPFFLSILSYSIPPLPLPNEGKTYNASIVGTCPHFFPNLPLPNPFSLSSLYRYINWRLPLLWGSFLEMLSWTSSPFFPFFPFLENLPLWAFLSRLILISFPCSYLFSSSPIPHLVLTIPSAEFCNCMFRCIISPPSPSCFPTKSASRWGNPSPSCGRLWPLAPKVTLQGKLLLIPPLYSLSPFFSGFSFFLFPFQQPTQVLDSVDSNRR